MRRDLPRIAKPIGGLQFMLPLLIILILCLAAIGWRMMR